MGRAFSLLMLACMLTVACTPKSLGYERIRYSDQYIARSQLQKIVEERQSRSEVIALFGAPDAENVEAGSIGYQRCVTSSGYVANVPPARLEIESCQRVGLWIADNQRVVAWKEARHTSDDGPYRSTLREWIEVPERHLNREQLQEDVDLDLRRP
jgi:hypothetical protein